MIGRSEGIGLINGWILCNMHDLFWGFEAYSRLEIIGFIFNLINDHGRYNENM